MSVYTGDDGLGIRGKMVRSGYTLPVFACGSAIAALQYLRGETEIKEVTFDLVTPKQTVTIPIEQGAKITENQALAITRSDPGDNLDLTRNTPIWAFVTCQMGDQSEIEIKGGAGIGIQQNHEGKVAIYRYANELLQHNLTPYLHQNQKITVTLILPEGRQLALRTSNAAFGVVDGLSLLGTTGISRPLTAKEQLDAYQADLRSKADKFKHLVFCIGENGLDLGQKMGIDPQTLVKTANWIGSMLVTAASYSVKSVVLLGYHGKLVKLAGGIFHTHHYLADGRQEILMAQGVKVGLPLKVIQEMGNCPTLESALKYLKTLENGEIWSQKLYYHIAETIDNRCQDYIERQIGQKVAVGSVLFDGDRQVIVASQTAQQLGIKGF